MDIIEKQVEKVKEVPYGYGDCDGYSYGRRGNIRGIAGTGLGLGIAGTVLGGAALLKNGGWGLFGNRSSMPQNVNINTDNSGVSREGLAYGIYGTCAPTTFQVWEKECEDAMAAQKALYDYAILDQNERFNDRQTLNSELFSVWKSQVDSDFGLYKESRDSFDKVIAKHNADSFALYKNQRDGFDTLAARISALETKQAVNDAVDPWRAKVLDMRINGVAAGAQAAVNLEAERRCCADNKIVNYVNSTFYPIEVADLTVGTTSTAKEVYNPLCGCCKPCM